MKPQIQFFYPNETLHYKIKQSVGKILYQNKQNVLFFEVESTDDLYHVEADSVQNNFPEIILSIEDFPVSCAELEELLHQELEIPLSVGEVLDEEGEAQEVFYTNLNLNDEDDLETNENSLKFFTDDSGELCMIWKGKCAHFEEDEQDILFEVCSKVNFKEEIKDYDEMES